MDLATDSVSASAAVGAASARGWATDSVSASAAVGAASARQRRWW
jgi:hypothetical protein